MSTLAGSGVAGCGWRRCSRNELTRKQRHTLKQMYAELVALRYDGSYNRTAAFASDWEKR